MRARRRPAVAPALLAGLLGLLGCARHGPGAARRPGVVALVGDRPVELTSLQGYVREATGEELAEVSPRVASSLLDQYLEELLLARAVEEAQPPLGGKTAAERRKELVARRANLSAITDEELKSEYDAHPERWQKPPLVRLSQLLLPSRAAAEEALKKLASGTPWAEISRAMSVAPNAPAGGALGLLARGDLPREFEQAIWSVRAGGVTPPLAAPHGYHVFRVEERFEERVVPFAEARAGLRLEMAEQHSTAAAAQLLDETRRAHPVRVVEEHLPFPYVGSAARFSLDSSP